MLTLGASALSPAEFCGALAAPGPVRLTPEARARLESAHRRVLEIADGPEPVYGLNTGLGANLATRIAPADIPAFQLQLIRGRAVAAGPPLSEGTGHAVILARLLSAANGASGLSPALWDHLAACFAAGLSPVIPAHGSIGAADLTQTAVWGLALLGEGRIWLGDAALPAAQALESAGLAPPPLGPRDAMALASQPGLTTALAAQALHTAETAFVSARAAALLSYAGHDANRAILSPDTNAPRPSPGQQETAAWFLRHLDGQPHAPRRIQEALSFRQVAPTFGAAGDALARASAIWRNEANGTPDSPVLTPGGALVSTPNFHGPALALGLEHVSLALAMLGHGALMRLQKLMMPDLSGLPRYLSPVGGASAGMVPLQKTATALHARIRHLAYPVALDAATVSDAVEDMAPMTSQAAQKLADQAQALILLAGCESLVALQAVHLRGATTLGPSIKRLYSGLISEIAPLTEDRPLGPDIDRAAAVLPGLAATL